MGKSMLGIGALALGGFGLAVASAASFEKILSGVKAVLNGTEADMEKLRQKAFDLGRTSQFSSKEVAAGFEDMAKAGLNASEILGGAADAAVALASAAGNMKLDTAAEIMVNAMRTFELGAGDLTHVADVLAGAANASTVEVDDLAVSLRYAGAVAHTQGVSIDELSTALAILGDRGIRGSTAGTSLRGVLLSLTGTSGPAKDALRELGIITNDGANAFFTAEGKMKSLAEVSQILQDKTKGLSQQQKTQAFNTIFQRRAMASALVLAQEGAAGFAKYTAEIQKISAADVAAIKLDNLAGRFKILKSSVQTLLIQFGEAFQATLQGWVEKLTKVVNWISSLDDGTKKVIAQVILAIGVFSTIAGTVLLFTSAMIKAYRTTKDLIAGVKLISAALKLMGTSLLANPVFLVIAGLVALGIALFVAYKKSESFRKIVDGLWQSLQKLWDSVSGAGVAAWHALNTAFDAVVGAGKKVIDWVKNNWDILVAILTGPAGTVLLVWRRFGDEIKNGIKVALDAVVGFFTALPGRIIGFISAVISAVVGLGSRMLGAITTGVPAAIDAFRDFMAKLPYWAGYAIGFAIGAIVKFGIDLVTNTIEFGGKFIEAVVQFFSQLPTRVSEFVTAAFNHITKWIADSLTKVGEFGSNFIAKVVEFFSQLPGRVAGFLVETYNKITQFTRDAIAKAIEVGSGVLNKIVEFVSQLPGKVGGFLGDTATRLKNSSLDFLVAAVTLGKNIFDGLWDQIKGLPGLVGDLLSKIIKAIKERIQDGFNAVREFAKGLWDGFKKGLGISSPSYIEEAMFAMTANVGREITTLQGQIKQLQGLGNGITAHSPEIGLGIAESAGVVSSSKLAASSSAVNAKNPEVAGGDVINITGADERSALDISRQIMFDKRVRISS